MSNRYLQVEAALRTVLASETDQQDSQVDHYEDVTQSSMFQFETRYVPRTYVVIDGEKYCYDKLMEILVSLKDSDGYFVKTLVPRYMQSLIKRYQLGTPTPSGAWAGCMNEQIEDFIDRLECGYIDWEKSES